MMSREFGRRLCLCGHPQEDYRHQGSVSCSQCTCALFRQRPRAAARSELDAVEPVLGQSFKESLGDTSVGPRLPAPVVHLLELFSRHDMSACEILLDEGFRHGTGAAAKSKDQVLERPQSLFAANRTDVHQHRLPEVSYLAQVGGRCCRRA